MSTMNALTIDEDILEIEALEEEAALFQSCEISIEDRPIHKSTVAVLCARRILTTTALESMGMESLYSDSFAEKDCEIAREALLQTAKEKVSQWATKIISAVKNFATGIMDFLKPVWNAISNKASELMSFTWEKAKDAGAYVKAHPFKTILGVLAAAALVLGIAKFSMGSMPKIGSPVSALKEFMTKISGMAKSVVSPIGKIFTKTDKSGVVTLVAEVTENAAPVEKSLSVLGWTKQSVGAITTKLKSIWDGVGSTVKPFWEKYLKPVADKAEMVVFLPKKAGEYIGAKSGSGIAKFGTEMLVGKFYIPIMFKFAMNIFSMIKAFVVKAFTMIRDTLSAIRKTITG